MGGVAWDQQGSSQLFLSSTIDFTIPNYWLERAKRGRVGAMQSRTTSAAWIRGVVNTFSSNGLDVASLFADAELPLSALEDPNQRWPTEQVNRLWSLAVERSKNPAIALTNAHVPRPDQYGVVSYVMMSSSDLQTGLERFDPLSVHR